MEPEGVPDLHGVTFALDRWPDAVVDVVVALAGAAVVVAWVVLSPAEPIALAWTLVPALYVVGRLWQLARGAPRLSVGTHEVRLVRRGRLLWRAPLRDVVAVEVPASGVIEVHLRDGQVRRARTGPHALPVSASRAAGVLREAARRARAEPAAPHDEELDPRLAELVGRVRERT